MSVLPRLSLVAGILGASWIGLNLVYWNEPTATAQQDSAVHYLELLFWEEQRSETLDHNLSDLLQSFADKRSVVVALLSERVSLLEAAARFRAINQHRTPLMWQLARQNVGASCEGEHHCREVLHSIRGFLADDPCRLAAIESQLENELKERQRSGHLTLPASPSK